MRFDESPGDIQEDNRPVCRAMARFMRAAGHIVMNMRNIRVELAWNLRLA